MEYDMGRVEPPVAENRTGWVQLSMVGYFGKPAAVHRRIDRLVARFSARAPMGCRIFPPPLQPKLWTAYAPRSALDQTHATGFQAILLPVPKTRGFSICLCAETAGPFGFGWCVCQTAANPIDQ